MTESLRERLSLEQEAFPAPGGNWHPAPLD